MPNQTKNLSGTGASGAHAQAISGYSMQAITAAGTTQATAFQLTADVNEVTTTAAGSGALLPVNCVPSDETLVGNFGANALLVYPQPGESINAIAVNGSFSVAAGGRAYFVKASNTRWMAILSA